MLKVFIVDDESAARRGLHILLRKFDDVEIVGEADGVRSAKLMLSTIVPDVVLLDVEMSNQNGFLLKEFLSPNTQIIFVTSHSKYAAEAFEIEALDYVLKPVVEKRLREALNRAIAHSHKRESSVRQLILTEQGVDRVVSLANIIMLKADGDYTSFSLKGSADLFIARGIGKFQKELPEDDFLKVNRSLIVNVSYIEKLEVQNRDLSFLYLKGVESPLLIKRQGMKKIRSYLKT